MYMPEHYDRKELNEKRKLKKILIYDHKGRFNTREVPNGQAKFLADNCPVNSCEIVRDMSQAESADAILFKVKIERIHSFRLNVFQEVVVVFCVSFAVSFEFHCSKRTQLLIDLIKSKTIFL